jgi:methylenetetrahydrofolate reductase (NADPH)
MNLLLKQSLMKLASSASFETTPKTLASCPDLTAILAPSTRVAVTFLPGSDFQDTIETSKLLKDQGFSPIPTLCARSFRNVHDLKDGLSRLASALESSIGEVYVFAGSESMPTGDLETSMDLLQTGLLDKYGIKRIGVAGHPEGLPGVSERELDEALLRKNAFAAERTEAELFLVTQFCFEADAVIQWERRIRQTSNNRLPIHIGVPGIATASTLLKHAQNCGVGPSMRVLQQKGGNLSKLLQTPSKLLLDLAKAKLDDPDNLIDSIHWYPFGGLEKTAEYAKSMERGEFEIEVNQESFQIL